MQEQGDDVDIPERCFKTDLFVEIKTQARPVNDIGIQSYVKDALVEVGLTVFRRLSL